MIVLSLYRKSDTCTWDHGFKTKTHSIKISQLADDTTLFCTSKEEIYIAFNEIETFGSFSGLLMNKNKTGGIWVGKLKHSKDKLEGIKKETEQKQ